jgi:hypothetical protein
VVTDPDAYPPITVFDELHAGASDASSWVTGHVFYVDGGWLL